MATFACVPTKEKKVAEFERTFLCNAELVNNEKWRFAEADGKNIVFQNLDTRTNEKAFSGEFSALLTPEKPYGFTTEIDSILPDDYIQIKIWRNSFSGDGSLIIDGGNGIYDGSRNIAQTGENGWQQLLLEFFVPPNFNSGKVKIYAWNTGKEKVFFDDLEIIHRRNKIYPAYDSLPKLRLFTDSVNIEYLANKRMLAFESGVLKNNDEDFADVILFYENDFLNAGFRLKGDLVDHLKGRKWSFRFKLKSSSIWNSLVSFSVHNPIARDFLSEWLAHQVFLNEDILTTRYGFIPLELNGENLGIYAWEEHFEKQLLESKNRREGPIVKFDESIFWERVLQTNIKKREWNIDYFNAAEVLPFKENKTISDTTLYPQFLEAQKLMQQYRDSKTPISEIIDVDKLAKYYALVDLTRAYHGFTWHNQRFFYNQTTCLLEPIAFDGYTEDGVYQRIEEPVTGLLNPEKLESLTQEELMLFQVFADEKFNTKYINYLHTYSTEEYLIEIKKHFQNKIDSLENIIQFEFPAYHFNLSVLDENARIIRENLPLIHKNINELGKLFQSVLLNKPTKYYSSDVNKKLTPMLVRANYDLEKRVLQIHNFHGGVVEVSEIKSANGQVFSFNNKTEIAQKNSQTILFDDFVPDSITFLVNGVKFTSGINKWPLVSGKTPRQISLQNSILDLPIKNDTLIFDGKYKFNKDFVLADSLTIIARSGTEIDLLEGASFISLAAIYFEGTETNPIKIFSSDHSAKGFNILQTKDRSYLKHVHFSGISNLNKGGWKTPAAVTFYEANVDLENCIFEDNSNCDDALNIVRSEFSVTNCAFENTFADAFDSDFCTGKVTNCTFKNIGNDAIDFSGSTVEITDCKMIEISDKAISGGENSKLIVTNCQILKANIGVASKDLSELKLDKITMEQTVYGLVAFVKKPEFGPAKITVDNLRMKNNVIFHKIETGSVLTVNGKTINGGEKNLAVKLYQ